MSSTEGECRAAVWWEEGLPLTIENITVDPPKTGEVRVKMVAAGLCATDGHMIWGQSTDLPITQLLEGNPMVLGHEGGGIVESVGPNVTSLKPGDKVIATGMPQCDKCQWCANPMTNFCMSDNFQTTIFHQNKETRMKINGKPLLAFCGTSNYSQYAVIRETQLAKVNPKADLKTLCILGCAVGTGYGSVFNIAKVHPGAKCAIWGLGAIGLSAVLACKAAGASEIVGVDTNSDKESFAKQFGATQYINPKVLGEPIESHFQKQGGLDHAFDCVGSQFVLDAAYNSLAPWGALTVIGLGPEGNKVEAKVADLLSGRRIQGGYFGIQMPREAIQGLVEKYLSGSLPIDGLITHRISLDDINDGFDRLKAGKTIRTIIEF